MSNLESVREDIEVIKGSCNDCLDLGLEPEIIFHLGIPTSPMYKKNPSWRERPIAGMVAILELARQKGARKVVFVSSSSVYNGVPLRTGRMPYFIHQIGYVRRCLFLFGEGLSANSHRNIPA